MISNGDILAMRHSEVLIGHTLVVLQLDEKGNISEEALEVLQENFCLHCGVRPAPGWSVCYCTADD